MVALMNHGVPVADLFFRPHLLPLPTEVLVIDEGGDPGGWKWRARTGARRNRRVGEYQRH